MRGIWALGLVGVTACGSGGSSPHDAALADAAVVDGAADAEVDAALDPYMDPVQAQTRVLRTLTDLAAMGNKRAGSATANQASQYIFDRFTAMGLQNVHFETFKFLAFDPGSSALAVTANGTALPMPHDVLAYSGSGHASGDVVNVGIGAEGNYMGLDATGKVVLVTRDAYFHRSSAYRQVISHGGAAMLYVSTSPDNLIQIGTVADPEDGVGPLPTVTVGGMDGDRIKAALTASQTVHATIDVAATVHQATGRNVIGSLPGSDPGGAYFELGAHFDTWYKGSVDNSSGVAMLLETAEAAAHQSGRQRGLVFVGYDAEELGLFGGYDYLRKHVIVAHEPMLAFLNFEMPASQAGQLHALAATLGSPLRMALSDSMLQRLYTAFVTVDFIPPLYGGQIPTDMQGMYWYGLQGFTTFCDSPYYHTPEDTIDKVDTLFLAKSAVGFGAALGRLDSAPPAMFQSHKDPSVWQPTVDVGTGSDRVVTVTAKDNAGVPQPNAQVRVWLDVDDFTRAFDMTVTADASGVARVTIPAAALAMGTGSRWIDVTAGANFPQSEDIIPLP